jgi:hypothetical protein
MEIADLQIDNIVHQVCEKTKIPVFFGSAGRQIIVLTCCKSFTERVKKDLTEALGEKFVRENFRFRTGYLEYV